MDAEHKSENNHSEKIHIEAHHSEKKSTAKKSDTMKGLITGIAIAFIVLAGAWYALNTKNTAKAVAIVNGTTITQTDFDRLLAQQLAAAARSQSTVTEEALAEQVLENLIVETILIQQADELGITIPDESIEDQIEQVKSQFPDEETFIAMLSSDGYTVEQMRESIIRQSRIQAYLDAALDLRSVTVTEEEIQEAYDMAKAGQEDLPVIELIRESIVAQLTQQKQFDRIVPHIENLKTESDIETFVE